MATGEFAAVLVGGSSLVVFAHGSAGPGRRHRIDDPTGPPEGLLTGDQQSKWVTERNLALARERGLPVSCYRVARVCGDRATGACQGDDLLWRVVAGAIRIGGVPLGVDVVYDLVPVDHVVAALVWLSAGPTWGAARSTWRTPG
jgi:thioester reductase-like protein